MSNLAEPLHWSVGFFCAVAAHAAAILFFLGPPEPQISKDFNPPMVVMMTLPPVAVAREVEPVDAPPARDLNEVVPQPEPPPVEIPVPPTTRVAALQSGTPAKSPTVRQVGKSIRKKAASPPAAPPPSAQRTEEPSAHTTEASFQPDSALMPSWKTALLRHLERHKVYPREAQRARQQGITYIRFTMSRDGRILHAVVDRTAGFPRLDREGVELLYRAQPLPALPADQPGESVALIVPVQFTLRR
jgi:protein TonB